MDDLLEVLGVEVRLERVQVDMASNIMDLDWVGHDSLTLIINDLHHLIGCFQESMPRTTLFLNRVCPSTTNTVHPL